MRGWAVVLILFTALLPCLAVIVDLFARLRRRHIPLAPALRSYRSRLAFWLYAVLLFELFALLGVWETGADRPLAPELSPGTQWPTVGLAVYGALLAGGWLVGRDRLLPRRPVADAEQLAGQVGALLALAVLSLLVVAMNPYSVLFLLPSLHAWIWLPQLRNGPWRCARSPTSPDSAGLSCSSARSRSGSISASTRPGTSRSWLPSASCRFRRCS